MEMLHGSRQLIHGWKARGMEGDGYEGEAVTGFHLQDYLLQLLRQRETRERRVARLLATLLLLLMLGVLALLVVAGVERKCHASPHNQTEEQPHRHSSDTAVQQKKVGVPRALLTAPYENPAVTAEGYLRWEPTKGNAYCEGGFNYSNGELQVPRSGYYRVYLQLTYVDINSMIPILLEFSVLVIGDAYDENRPLMSSQETVVCREVSCRKSIYTAVTFKLRANDRLRVKSNYQHFISRSERLVFFGAELLPE
ncbi:lymphotoxin-alpha-like [Leuresthes tenuis]|uniref:lymphotoxin-alpha-like n=1 Tax=Leuresthes tenuis TaxID=355514 RepID=UPI003B50C98F